jgi:uncharacterized RDD family membrane protein YckC
VSPQPSQNKPVTSYAAVADETGIPSEPHPTPALAMSEAQSRGRQPQVLRVRAAGFPRRLAAALVDVCLVVSLSVAVSLGAMVALGVPIPTLKELGPDLLMAGLLDRNPMAAGALGLLFGLSALYQIYLGGVLGQTLGKRLFGLRVISSHGRMPGPLLASVRFLAMVLSLALAGLGFVWCLFDRERRALHDHLSCTYVILDER